MFVVKVNGKPKSVLNNYQDAACFADMVRGRGKKITISTLPVDEIETLLRCLDYLEAAGFSNAAGRPGVAIH